MKLESLSDRSRVWVYQADRSLTSNDVQHINAKLDLFLSTWNAHGKDLLAGAEVLDNLFVIIAVDEELAKATGCSIDKSVHLMKELGSQLDVDFFNRLIIAIENDQSIELIPIKDFEEQLNVGNLSKDSRVFNNLVSNLGEFRSNWRTTVGNSWHAQLLP